MIIIVKLCIIRYFTIFDNDDHIQKPLYSNFESQSHFLIIIIFFIQINVISFVNTFNARFSCRSWCLAQKTANILKYLHNLKSIQESEEYFFLVLSYLKVDT